MHRLGDRREVEVIGAPGRDAGADEDAVDKKRRGDLLQPKPGTAYGAGHDVEEHRGDEARQANSAQDHDDPLEHVEGAPFQMALRLQYDAVTNAHRRLGKPSTRGRQSRPRDAPPRLPTGYLIARARPRILTAFGPSCWAIWSCNG